MYHVTSLPRCIVSIVCEDAEVKFSPSIEFLAHNFPISALPTHKNFLFSSTQESSQDPEESGKDSSNGSLGCVQISVTAATPMVEDADKEFLPQEEEEARDSPPEPEPEVQQPQPTQQQQPQAVTEVYNDTILEESEPDEDDEPMKSPPKMAPPPLPPAAKEDTEPDPNAFEANFEAAFEANFDNAFGDDSEVPKQVVGGRASIPDELEPQQLARLQDLKESNA